ncbi:MAG: DnaD domain-containing protein [Bacilli bacterium]
MDKLINVLKEGNVSFPKLLLKSYKNLNISCEEFIVLIYIMNDNSDNFNPKAIREYLGLTLENVLNIIDSLTSKDIIKIEIRKINNIREEFINIEFLYRKLAYIAMNEKEIELSKKETTIFDLFEQEFGRTLSPMEYEIINGWLDASFKEDLIIHALKEATYNGVSNLRYIDKILFEWKKKGFQIKDDVEKSRIPNQNKVEQKEMFDYNWLDDIDE